MAHLPVETRPRPARPPAFTLIELLVVIAIIALLIALLSPALQGARKMAQAATCLSNLHQSGSAIFSYSEDNNGFAPAMDIFATTATYIHMPIKTTPPQRQYVLACPCKVYSLTTSSGTNQTFNSELDDDGSNSTTGGVPHAGGAYYWTIQLSHVLSAESIVEIYDAHLASEMGIAEPSDWSSDYAWNVASFEWTRHPGGSNALFVDLHATPLMSATNQLGYPQGQNSTTRAWIPGTDPH
jgi:prepilin-type N-terminal cleavage/methylation domain-containing protein/prepilin-type processing-associated H-X9-DG protein